MSKDHYSIRRQTITDITDAIRTKCGTSDPIALSNAPTLIAGIPQTITGYPIKHYVQRGDAERIQRWETDELLVQDSVAARPTYSTSAKTILTGATLSPTIATDHANYNYYILMRGLAIPIYDNAVAKGRTDYDLSCYNYELNTQPANTIYSVSGTKSYTSRHTIVQSLGSVGRTIYWSSATAIAVLTNITYGFYITSQAPTYSNSAITVKAPSYGCRGHTTYCTSANWTHMTDIRFQWVIDVYRAPKNAASDGWQLENMTDDCYEDIHNGGTLVPR